MSADPMVEWLRSVLNHTERVAKEAAAGPWSRDDSWDDPEDGLYGREVTGATGFKLYDEGGHTSRDATHIALHDPRAVLARVEAERAVLREHTHDHRGSCSLCYDRDQSLAPLGVAQNDLVPWPCPTLRWLAYGHRYDYPDWRTEWAPEGMAADA